MVVALPACTLWIPIPKLLKLRGVTMPVAVPSINIGEILAGTVQSYVEERFKRNSIAWPILVRSDNEVNVNLFSQLSSNYHSHVLLGTENRLFESSYILFPPLSAPVDVERYKLIAQKLSLLQERLQERGVTFLLVVSPSKVAMYPDIIPQEYLIGGKQLRLTSLDILVPYLDEKKVNYVNAPALLKSAESRFQIPFFAPGGTHWNGLAGCLVTSEIANRLDLLMGKSLPRFSCSVQGRLDKPAIGDMDLARLTNIWSEQRFAWRSPRVVRKRFAGAGSAAPRLFIEGTSFTHELRRQFKTAQLFSKVDFYYYARRIISEGGVKGGRPVPVSQVDWKEVENHDVIMMEINESVVSSVGHGFIDEALQRMS